MKLNLLFVGTALCLLPAVSNAQGNSPAVEVQNDGDLKMESPEGTLKVDNDGDAKLKFKDGRKLKVDADGDIKKKPRKAWERAEAAEMKGPPAWAPAHGYRSDRHVYFPDYYTFYDPNRGYVYWQEDRWVTSRTLPVFMHGVDLNGARMNILDDVELSAKPEVEFRLWRERYPAENDNTAIPRPRD